MKNKPYKIEIKEVVDDYVVMNVYENEHKPYPTERIVIKPYNVYIENKKLNNIINELDKQNGELGADLSIIKDRVIKTNWWLENMLKQATNRETKAIINGALDLLLGSDKE